MKRLFRYTFFRIAKRIIRFFVAFSLILSICFGSVFYQYQKVEAAPVGALAVVGAIGSILGIANVTSGGSVTGLFAEQKDKIQQWWSNYTGNGGIYLDSDNNYVFSGEATNALYDSLDANSSTDSKVVSSFGATSLNVPADFYTELNSWRAEKNIEWKNILKCNSSIVCNEGGSSEYEFFACCYVDLTNVAFILVSYNSSSNSIGLSFYDANSVQITPLSYVTSIKLRNSDYFGKYTGSASSKFDTGRLYYKDSSGYVTDSTRGRLYSNTASYFSSDSSFVLFPFNVYSASRSLILAKNVGAGNSVLNKKEGTYITNNYYGSQIPPISKTVFEENNWDSVYNSYINNINTNNENWYVDGEVDVQALRDEMAKQSNIIKDAIIQGNVDIADKIDYTNEWLKKIYNLLQEIKTLVANNQGGGGSSSTDLSNVEDKLDLVNTNFSELITQLENVSSDLQLVLEYLSRTEDYAESIDTKLDDLEQNYIVLSNIYEYMQSHPWGSGGGGGGDPFITPTEDPWEPWFKYIDDEDNDFPYDAILTKYNVIKTLIQAAAPYCFISFIGGVFNAFSTEAVTPEFVIPIKVNNSIINIDEEVQVDLSYLDDLIVYIHAAFIILVTVGLMWFSFPFIRNLIQIFEL